MNNEAVNQPQVIDMHVHVGLVGDLHPHWGRMSDWYRKQLTYRVFLLYGRLRHDQVSDRTLREATVKTIVESKIDRVVCLALDPVYDSQGKRHEERSHLWVDNDYVIDLQREIGDKVLLGASVHPYDSDFQNRVRKYVNEGAVLLKWLPSAMQFDLAEPKVREALEFLATCRDGKPLPLLLHVGPEYAIPSTDPSTTSYDFVSWTISDEAGNFFRGRDKWRRPRSKEIHENITAGLEAGAIIIFAHCGLPYFAPNWVRGILEHSDFKSVRQFLRDYPAGVSGIGQCYADISACATPFRSSFFSDIRELPAASLVFGSDFPTPVFELSANLKEAWKDFKAVLAGQFERIIVPQDNPLDVNYRELSLAFSGHPAFTNFSKLMQQAKPEMGTMILEA